DIFLVKYSSNGMHQWSRSYGTTAAVGDIGNAVAVDGANNVLLTGSIVGAVDFGGGALAGNGSYDVFIAKFRSDASHLWSKRAGALYDDHGWGIAADSTGNVFSTGDFYQSINFGGGTLVNEAGTDSYVVKLSP
ncbi:MAG TPA: nucleotide-binding protein, partial [Thermoanaerobaculia bacterium]